MKFRPVYIVGVVFLLIAFYAIYRVLLNLGVNYDKGLASIIPRNQQPPSLRKVKTIRKVTIIDEDMCTDITPDGIVRTYVRCDGETEDANRLANTKNIVQLMQMLGQIDLSKYRQRISGPYITLVIETDSGTETIYVPTGGGGNDITKIIDQINGDLPQPTATPGVYSETPTPTLGGISNTPTPTPLISNTPGPSPTPSPTTNPENPFSCGFTESAGGPRPYNVSNYICSTEPSPAP